MGLSWQSQFRAIFIGLVLADLMALWHQPTPDPEAMADNTLPQRYWKPLMVRIGAALCREEPPDWAAFGPQIAALREYPVLLSLSALPLLLLNLEAPSRGEVTITAWADQQELPPLTQAVLLEVFRLLQRRLAAVPAKPPTQHIAELTRPADLTWLKTADQPVLQPAVDHVLQAQGQYELALRHSLRGSTPSPGLIPLVGALAALHGGWVSLPLAWRVQVFNSSQGKTLLRQHWSIDQESQLVQLSDQLFYGWIGVSPMLRSVEGGSYPVLQMSS